MFVKDKKVHEELVLKAVRDRWGEKE